MWTGGPLCAQTWDLYCFHPQEWQIGTSTRLEQQVSGYGGLILAELGDTALCKPRKGKVYNEKQVWQRCFLGWGQKFWNNVAYKTPAYLQTKRKPICVSLCVCTCACTQVWLQKICLHVCECSGIFMWNISRCSCMNICSWVGHICVYIVTSGVVIKEYIAYVFRCGYRDTSVFMCTWTLMCGYRRHT